ncbi:Katanin p80 wd40 repeat-containing subunit b1-like protein [Thalictrum thalictroides]|uniref:Katanin p80 wd40 repeat-containing subunit b1-like protein n=1 Tax=Thalictrum thalictroides TaxID=46969 RepID=A0A7J6VUJ7_THATH|nr:Katanin p80 wd40 repeat-containing subunit b1-like protein [Thalictrum thalictroides]
MIIQRIEPYSVATATRSNGRQESKSTASGSLSVLTDNSVNMGRLSLSQDPDPMVKEAKALGRLSVSQNSDLIIKESRVLTFTSSVPGTPQRVGSTTGPKSTTASSVANRSAATLKRSSSKSNAATNLNVFSKSDVVPVIVPRTSSRVEQAAEIRKELGASGRTTSFSMHQKANDFPKLPGRDDSERSNVTLQSRIMGCKTTELSEMADQNFMSSVDGLNQQIQ